MAAFFQLVFITVLLGASFLLSFALWAVSMPPQTGLSNPLAVGVLLAAVIHLAAFGASAALVFRQRGTAGVRFAGATFAALAALWFVVILALYVLSVFPA